MQIVYVSDGKAGHRSQALGLFCAIQRLHHDAKFVEIPFTTLSITELLVAIFTKRLKNFSYQPDFILGVGSHTHSRVLLLGKIFKQAKTVILMKPSLPITWFNYAVVPKHDGISEQGHVIVTEGALNPIVNENRHVENRILIALGGSSKRHKWHDEKVLNALEQIVANNPESTIILTTSRRTPKAFLPQLLQQAYAKKLQIFPVEDTPQGWIFEEMQKAEAVWVTEDSVSMIYEALTAGCSVGVMEMQRLKSDRITKMMDQLQLHMTLDAKGNRLLQLQVDEAFKVATILLQN